MANSEDYGLKHYGILAGVTAFSLAAGYLIFDTPLKKYVIDPFDIPLEDVSNSAFIGYAEQCAPDKKIIRIDGSDNFSIALNQDEIQCMDNNNRENISGLKMMTSLSLIFSAGALGAIGSGYAFGAFASRREDEIQNDPKPNGPV